MTGSSTAYSNIMEVLEVLIQISRPSIYPAVRTLACVFIQASSVVRKRTLAKC